MKDELINGNGAASSVRAQRMLSIDVLRGYTMFWLIGGAGLIMALAKALPSPFTDALSVQMTHAPWGSFRHHDLIFPMFLFLAGASWPFSLAARRERGMSTLRIANGILRRFLVLFVLGATLFGLLGFDFAHVRFNSILGRIGFGWGVAALGTLFFKGRWNWLFAASLFFGYWAAQQFLPLVFSPGLNPWGDGNFQSVFDGWLGGRVPDKYGAEGFFQAFGCISSAYLGVFAGQILKRRDYSQERRLLMLFIWSAALAAGAFMAWSTGCRCIKSIWSATYILVSGSLSFFLLATVYWIVDMRRWTRWSFFFRIIGANAITIYVLQWAWSFPAFSRKVFGGIAGLAPEVWSEVILQAGGIQLKWLLLWYLYRRKIFIRI